MSSTPPDNAIASAQRMALIAGVVGVGVAALGLAIPGCLPHFFRAWLVAFNVFTGASVGALVVLMLLNWIAPEKLFPDWWMAPALPAPSCVSQAAFELPCCETAPALPSPDCAMPPVLPLPTCAISATLVPAFATGRL